MFREGILEKLLGASFSAGFATGLFFFL